MYMDGKMSAVACYCFGWVSEWERYVSERVVECVVFRGARDRSLFQLDAMRRDAIGKGKGCCALSKHLPLPAGPLSSQLFFFSSSIRYSTTKMPPAPLTFLLRRCFSLSTIYILSPFIFIPFFMKLLSLSLSFFSSCLSPLARVRCDVIELFSIARVIAGFSR